MRKMTYSSIAARKPQQASSAAAEKVQQQQRNHQQHYVVDALNIAVNCMKTTATASGGGTAAAAAAKNNRSAAAKNAKIKECLDALINSLLLTTISPLPKRKVNGSSSSGNGPPHFAYAYRKGITVHLCTKFHTDEERSFWESLAKSYQARCHPACVYVYASASDQKCRIPNYSKLYHSDCEVDDFLVLAVYNTLIMAAAAAPSNSHLHPSGGSDVHLISHDMYRDASELMYKYCPRFSNQRAALQSILFAPKANVLRIAKFCNTFVSRNALFRRVPFYIFVHGKRVLVSKSAATSSVAAATRRRL